MVHVYPESSHKFTSCDAIYRYCMGEQGVVTLQNPTNLKHHTYLFKKPAELNAFPEDVRFVYAVHNGNKLFYVGMIEQDKFRITRASRFGNHTEIVRGAYFIMRMMRDPKTLEQMDLYHQGVCCMCGRKLTSPKSIEFGIGPKCRKRICL